MTRKKLPQLPIGMKELVDLIGYDPETGKLTRKTPTKSGKKLEAGRECVCVNSDGYIQITALRRILLGHRLAWFFSTGEWPKGMIDHINGVKTDNRICNLREATSAINSQNRRSAQANKSGLLGVSWHAGKWRAKIQLNGKKYHLGRFTSPELAHEAYVRAKRRMHEGCTI